MKKISEVYVPAAKALGSLKKRKTENLTYEQKICLDFLKKHIKISDKKAEEMMNELQKVGRVDARQASMIVNNLPTTKDDVNLIFSKERTALKDDEIKKIIEIVNNYV